ncbi:MAG: LytTR family DNA-binding domain-containing protein, partial [Bacteroidales bacterium]|nr:LytTR family DNA-binding domain-containing protein [Bacteroidales bacterium]
MKVTIVDDEAKARDALEKILKEQFPEIDIIASAGTVETGCEAIRNDPPDLLLLDVELPDGTGFDLLEKIAPAQFKVVFITGHQEYAIEAIKFSALDYILKPFDSEDLQYAVEKAREAIDHEEQHIQLQTLNENLQQKKRLRRIILPTADNLHVVEVAEIIRAEADSNYTTFRLTGGKNIMVSRTMKEFVAMLAGTEMIRV